MGLHISLSSFFFFWMSTHTPFFVIRFVERYNAKWGMWVHAGDHYAFMNQAKVKISYNFFSRLSSRLTLLLLEYFHLYLPQHRRRK